MNTKTVTLILLAAGFLACGCADISEEEITGGDIDRTLPVPDGDDEAIETDVFGMLNLDWPGLEQVKAYYEADEYGIAYYLTVAEPTKPSSLPYRVFKVELTDLENGDKGEAIYYLEKENYIENN